MAFFLCLYHNNIKNISRTRTIFSDLLFTEVIDGSPVWLRHGKPLAVSGPDVDVDRTEVVVLLVTFGDQEETSGYKNICPGNRDAEERGLAPQLKWADVRQASGIPGVRLPGTFM